MGHLAQTPQGELSPPPSPALNACNRVVAERPMLITACCKWCGHNWKLHQGVQLLHTKHLRWECWTCSCGAGLQYADVSMPVAWVGNTYTSDDAVKRCATLMGLQAPKSEALAGRLSAVYGIIGAQDLIKQKQSHTAHKSLVRMPL